MILGSRSRWNKVALATVSLLVLAACSGTKQKSSSTAMTPAERKVAAARQAAAERTQRLGQLKKDVQVATASSAAVKDKLPALLAETDIALRLAEQYRLNAAKQKNPAQKQELSERAEIAQALADEKSKALVELRALVYADLERVRVLNQQVNSLEAYDKRQVAKKEVERPAKVKQTSTPRMAGREKKQM